MLVLLQPSVHQNFSFREASGGRTFVSKDIEVEGVKLLIGDQLVRINDLAITDLSSRFIEFKDVVTILETELSNVLTDAPLVLKFRRVVTAFNMPLFLR